MALRLSWRISSTVRQQMRRCLIRRRSLVGRTELRCRSIASSETTKEPPGVPWDELEESLKKLSPSNPDPRDVLSSAIPSPVHRQANGYGDWDPDEKYVDRGGYSVEPAAQLLPIIHVRATYNNTMFTITDHTGRVLAWTSAGAEGFKNARKGTTFAAQSAGMSAAKKAQKLGFNKVDVKLKGPGPGRQSALKGLEMGAVKVVSIQDVTPIPHNGCKPRKGKRR